MLAERTLTDFLQHSGEVLPDVERGEVRLRRRGGDDLVLVSGRHWDRLADSVRVLFEDSQLRALPSARPFATDWIGLLRPDDRAACVEELRGTLVAALATGRLADLEEAVEAWRATALATWDDERNAQRPGYAADNVRPLARP